MRSPICCKSACALGPRDTECLGPDVFQYHLQMPLYGAYADHADSKLEEPTC